MNGKAHNHNIMDRLMAKLFFVGIVSGVCLVASLLVLGLVAERAQRHHEVAEEVSASWGSTQTILGPVLVFRYTELVDGVSKDRRLYVLPDSLVIDAVLEPEIRSRGIFDTVVYTERLAVRGTFAQEDIPASLSTPSLVVAVTDTRSIEDQASLVWGGEIIPFEPGIGEYSLGDAGVHATVPRVTAKSQSFSFELTVRGTDHVSFAPIGRKTQISLASTWRSPQFVGSFLPTTRILNEDGFSATWQVSSFGRGYPQVLYDDELSSPAVLLGSLVTIGLNSGIDFYDAVSRSIKYAVLFIVVTFTSLFLFEVLTKLRIHPIQYFLVGAALALFYLLLLSLAEQVGLPVAYSIAASMVVLLVTSYSVSVFKEKRGAGVLCVVLSMLYGYLYFVLQLEDYALIFGSFLVFVLIAVVMYTTRHVDWFTYGGSDELRSGR